MKTIYYTVILLLMPLAAQAASNYETPQYSGIGARTDGGMQSPAAPRARPSGAIDRPAVAPYRLNDSSAGEKFLDRRADLIEKENQRRREELIRKIKTNE